MSDLTSLWRFDRPALAKELAQRTARQERIALFGPRQTGKTSLLLREVMPAFAKRGGLAVYAECWADKTDPMQSINYAVQKAIDDIRIPPAGLRRTLKTTVKKIGLSGGSLEFGDETRRTLPESKYLRFDALLGMLLRETDKPLLIVFDEFQALATAKDADEAAAAIRSALTQAAHRVGALFSGSSETLLLEMFTRSKAPLYSFARPQPYPLLDAPFVAYVAERYRQATRRKLNEKEALAVLSRLGHQPEPFLQAVSTMIAVAGSSLSDALDLMLDPGMGSKWAVTWQNLTPLQRESLRVVFEEQAPTAAHVLETMAARLKEPKVVASTVIRAVEALVNNGIVVKHPTATRAAYSVADPVMAAFLRRLLSRQEERR